MNEFRFLRIGVGITLVGFVLVVLLAGCGGSDEATSAPLSKKGFIKQGNAICDKMLGKKDAAVYREMQKLTNEGVEHISKRTMTHFSAEVVLPIYKSIVQELADLNPPAKDVKTINKMVSRYESVLDQLTKTPEKLIAAEPLAPNAEAEAYGLISCGL